MGNISITITPSTKMHQTTNSAFLLILQQDWIQFSVIISDKDKRLLFTLNRTQTTY